MRHTKRRPTKGGGPAQRVLANRRAGQQHGRQPRGRDDSGALGHKDKALIHAPEAARPFFAHQARRARILAKFGPKRPAWRRRGQGRQLFGRDHLARRRGAAHQPRAPQRSTAAQHQGQYQ